MLKMIKEFSQSSYFGKGKKSVGNKPVKLFDDVSSINSASRAPSKYESVKVKGSQRTMTLPRQVNSGLA